MEGYRVAGRFEVEREAGAGGMGTVYRARDLTTGELVAVKLLRGVEKGELERFAREARALSELHHPMVVRYVDHGTDASGSPYLAMEWLEGEDLGERLACSPLTIAESAELGRRVAEALATLHARSVVHRDLKPSNLFLLSGEIAQIKIIDFGIARLGFATQAVTRTGVGMGTPGYMAPEQARGAHDVDGRADVFSLGCVLFECLTGRPAFSGDHAVAVMAKLLFEEAPRVGDLCPDAPPPLAELVDRMLSKAPSERPESAARVAAELAAIEPLAPNDRGAARRSMPHAAARTALTATQAASDGDPRIVSVLLIATYPKRETPSAAGVDSDGDSTMSAASSPPAEISDVALRAIASEHAGRCATLLDGTRAVVITGAGVATDRAAVAAKCAIAIQRNCPDVLIALATGRGSVGVGGPVGETVDRAARLLTEVRAAAVAGAIKIDELTAGLLDDRFEVRAALGGLFLYGEREPDEAARTLLGKPTACVGRDRELRLLEDIFEECASEPAARAVLITGDPGVGKSRVSRELLRRIRARGEAVEIWTARGDPMRAGVPFGLLGQLVRGAVGWRGGEPLDARRQALASRVAYLIPSEERRRVTEFLGEIAGAPFPDEDSVELRSARQDPMLMSDQTRRAWADFVKAACGPWLVVIVLEDLHWSDSPTIEHIDAALRLVRDRPLMLLALARPSVRDAFPKLWATRGVQEVRLGELSRKACARFIKEALGPDAAEETIERLWRRSAGNAFFLEELVRAEAEGRGGDVPETVMAMLQSRLEGLSEGERRAVQAGSVLGDAFWRSALAGFCGVRASSPELNTTLQALEDKEFIVRRLQARFQGEAEYTFRHALVRDAAYGTLTEDGRALGHRLAGDWLEGAGEVDAAVLAEHFERGGDKARAASWFCRAARLSLEANDVTGVIEWAKRAEVCGAGELMLGEVRLVRAEAHTWLGEYLEAEACAAAALDVLPRRHARWYEALGRLTKLVGGRDDRDRVAELTAMMDEPAAEPEAALARLGARAQAAGTLLYVGAYEDGASLVRELEDEPLPDEPSVRANVILMRALSAVYRGDMDASRAFFKEAVECFRIAGNKRLFCNHSINLGVTYSGLGAYAEAASIVRAALSDAEQIGAQNLTGYAKHILSLSLARLGLLEEARELCISAIKVFEASGDRRFATLAHGYLAQIHLLLGDPSSAVDEALISVDRAGRIPIAKLFSLAVLSAVLLSQGSAREALEASRRALQILGALGGIEEGAELARLTYAEALHATGDPAARAAIADARSVLLARASRIADPRLRAAYLEAVPENARTLQLAREWLDANDEGTPASGS